MSDMPDYTHAVYTSVKNTWQDAENLDGTHGYISYIWIPEETYKVDLMKLHIYSEKFRAHSKSALAGGGTVVTSAGGGAHSHTVTGATSSYTVPSHTHNVAIGEMTSAATSGHTHKMFSYYTEGGVQATRSYYCQDSVGGAKGVALWAAQDTSDLYCFDGGGAHQHVVTIGTITSESGGGNHAHTISGQTAEAVTTHTHSVTLSDHTHDIEFGIYEEDITGRTLSAILYDPNGNVLMNFGVILTGEDSDILTLTDYFETLEYGMYKVELSASGRLRTRLVFYELCKMYAQY